MIRSINTQFHYTYIIQVTKNDEKVLQNEIRDIKEKLVSHETVVQELDRRYQQALEK